MVRYSSGRTGKILVQVLIRTDYQRGNHNQPRRCSVVISVWLVA